MKTVIYSAIDGQPQAVMQLNPQVVNMLTQGQEVSIPIYPQLPMHLMVPTHPAPDSVTIHMIKLAGGWILFNGVRLFIVTSRSPVALLVKAGGIRI